MNLKVGQIVWWAGRYKSGERVIERVGTKYAYLDGGVIIVDKTTGKTTQHCWEQGTIHEDVEAHKQIETARQQKLRLQREWAEVVNEIRQLSLAGLPEGLAFDIIDKLREAIKPLMPNKNKV